ncbi:MAG: carbon-nitrogen hydrolase family protein [Armatimonadota bacterium]|nr:carbon-nitrogen hydrolase family protein [Armatimonadota bacterium]
MKPLRMAFLHLAPLLGDIAHNQCRIEKAVITAADIGATVIITPELCVCGYHFAALIGTDWILPQPDAWMTHICQLAARLGITVFLSHPERDRESNRLYNSVFVITADGTIAGKHRKINVLPGAEGWSSPGEPAEPIPVLSLSVGILICADAYSPEIAQGLKTQGAQMLVSSAAWGPGLYGPEGEWEQCTLETGLPLFVCNRTGRDQMLDFTGATSIIAKEGQRLLSFQSDTSAILTIDWDLATQNFNMQANQTVYL